MVRSVQEGMYKRYYPKDPFGADLKKDVFSAPDKVLVGLLRQPVPFRIVLLLAKSGAMTHKELTAALRKAPSTVSHHLGKLVDAGAVERTPGGVGYRLADQERMDRILISFVPQSSSLVDGFIEIWDNLYV
jgi:predicted transcriptional regulator